MRELTKYILSPITLFAFLAAGTLMTLAGPFGTYVSLDLLDRAAYWYTLVGISIILGIVIRRAVDQKWPARSFCFRANLTAAVFTFLFTPCIILMNASMVWDETVSTDMPIWMMYIAVGIVPVSVNAVLYFMLKFRPMVPVGAPVDYVEETSARPRLFERLSDDLGEELIRMSVKDHFVHVYLVGGSERLRMRFGDAVQEVEGVPGMQVHRSHWVAKDAVEGYVQIGGRVSLCLSDGSEVPVSRNYRQHVEDAGFLAKEAMLQTSLLGQKPESRPG